MATVKRFSPTMMTASIVLRRGVFGRQRVPQLDRGLQGIHEPRPDFFEDLAGVGQELGLCLLVGRVTRLSTSYWASKACSSD